MADDVVLGIAQSQSVSELARIADQRAQITRRLSTGRTASEIGDDPASILRASALQDQAAGFLQAKSDIGQAISSLSAAQTGLESLEKLTDQLKGLAVWAQSADAEIRAELAQQFDSVRRQIGLLAADTSFLGTNLIDNPAASRGVSLSPAPGTELTVEGRASDAATLGIGDAASYGGFATVAGVETALNDLDAATRTLRSSASSFANDTALLQVRDSYSERVANVLEEGANKLTEADVNAEAASLLSIQTRDALAREGLRITSQSQSQLADLIGA